MFNSVLADASTTNLSTFVDAIKAALTDFTTANLSTVLVAGVGVAASLVVAWFAYRFIIRKVSGAMKKGRL